MQEEFDNKINAAFRQPVMDNDGYESWDDMMEDYQYENAGEIIAGAMITGVGPIPEAFNRLGLRDNLHGLMDVEYCERDGRPGYTMEIDRSGLDAPVIFVFERDGVFDLEFVKGAP